MKFLFGVMLLLLVANKAQAEPLIYLYTYHQKPPFIVDKDKRQGLYYDLAEELNKISPIYKFHTVYVPRKRLNLMLTKRNFDGVVVGVCQLGLAIDQSKSICGYQVFSQIETILFR